MCLRWGMLACIAWLQPAQDPTVTNEQPSVRPMSGTLLVRRSGRKAIEPLERETRVNPQDRVGTRAGEQSVFVAEQATVIRLVGVELDDEGGLGLERTGKRLDLKLYRGKVLVETFEAEVRVDTPQGSVEGSGSYFLVQIENKKTTVVAIEGKLTFFNSLGRVELKEGEESGAKEGEKPGEPKASKVSGTLSEMAARAAPVNLVKNPGFEEGLNHWDVSNSSGATVVCGLDGDVVHSGQRSVRIEVRGGVKDGGGSGVWLGMKQPPVALTAGKSYLFRGYVRVHTKKGAVIPFFSFAQGKGVRWTWAGAADAWRRVGGVFTAKDGDTRLSVEADVEAEEYSGTVWVDDFFLTELP